MKNLLSPSIRNSKSAFSYVDGKLFITILFFFNFIVANAQVFEWVKQMGGVSSDMAYSITTDANGNIYSTGFFSGKVDFDPGINTAFLKSEGLKDIYIQKLDANGDFLWAKQMGGSTMDDIGFSIITDAYGNVYSTGMFSDTVDFDPGVGVYNLISIGWSDAYIQKLNPNGDLIWAKQMGGGEEVIGSSISLDANGNIYSTGYFRDTVDFDPGIGTTNLASMGSNDIYIQKLDNNGDFLWAKQMGGTYTDQGRAIAVDASGNVYSTGSFSNTVDFDPGVGTADLTCFHGTDIFIQKLDTNGDFLWVKQMGLTTEEVGFSIAVDVSGNIYSTGFFGSTVDFDPGVGITNLIPFGEDDIYIQKLDPNGDFVWVKQMGGTDYDRGISITTDANENVYTTGYFRGNVDFDPGVGVTNLTSMSLTDADIFIQKLDSNGDFLWVKQMGGPMDDLGMSITTDVNGNIYTTGYFGNKVDFNPETGIKYLYSTGEEDIFIQKLRTSPAGIEENSFSNSVLVYPNPNNGRFSIDMGKSFPSVIVTIYDIKGKLIETEVFKESQLLDVKMKGEAGIYFVNIESEDSKAVIRLIKE